MLKPIVIYVPRASSVVSQIVEQLNGDGAEAYCNPESRPRNAVVVDWGMGGNKYAELRALAQSRVPCPRHSSAPAPGWIPRRRNHHEARDFTNPPGVSEPGVFWTEPVQTEHEFRVHVIHDQAFRTQYKYLPDGVTPLVKYGVPIRNHSLGWKFDPHSHRRFAPGVLNQITDAARAAVRALGYNFGVVDVGLNSHPVVFEINTRPDMDEYTRTAYVQVLKQLAAR